MKTILHLSSERTWRGGEQQLAYLLQELPQFGVQNVVAVRKNSAFEEWCKKNRQEHVSLSFANEFDLKSAWQLKMVCRERNINAVHAHSGHSHALAVWAHVLGNKLPIVLHRRVDFPIKQNALSRYKYNYPGIRKIICVSEAVKKILAQDLKHPEICEVIYDGIDLSKFPDKSPGNLRREYGIPEETPIVANVAALTHQKDYHTFIDTVELLVKQNLKAAFFIIGQGHLEIDLKQYAAQKQLQDKIIFTGFRTDIPEILPELDVLLFTSRTEGLGSTVLDAFACRVPVVSTNAGGLPELVQHNQTGLLANVGDSETLATHVQLLLQQPATASMLVAQASQKVLQFDKTEIARQTANTYKSL